MKFEDSYEGEDYEGIKIVITGSNEKVRDKLIELEFFKSKEECQYIVEDTGSIFLSSEGDNKKRILVDDQFMTEIRFYEWSTYKTILVEEFLSFT